VIVIGSRGLSGLKEMFKGSLSHQVAEHAGRPVLILPPPKPESAHHKTTGRSTHDQGTNPHN